MRKLKPGLGLSIGLIAALIMVGVTEAANYYFIRSADGFVAGSTTAPPSSPPTGFFTCQFDATSQANYDAAAGDPAGVTTQATPNAQGVCASAQFTPLATPTPTATPSPNPTIALTAAAGSGASFALVSGSNLQRGIINLTAGTSSSAGSIMTVTFPGGSPYIQIQAIGDNATAVGIGLRTLTSTVATVGARGAMMAGQIYQIGYVLVP